MKPGAWQALLAPIAFSVTGIHLTAWQRTPVWRFGIDNIFRWDNTPRRRAEQHINGTGESSVGIRRRHTEYAYGQALVALTPLLSPVTFSFHGPPSSHAIWHQ